MTWFRRRRRRAIALALSAAVVAVVAPTAVAATWEDTHSQDGAASRAASRLDSQSAGDLRSPDARDAALASEQQVQSQAAYRDLRSPDARDAGRDVATGSQLATTPAPVDTRTVITVQEKGSQTLAIVFSATALLIALLSVGFLALARRPRARWSAP